MLLGCIADDFTGGTDLANMLVKGGMRTMQTIGPGTAVPDDIDAVVVALKSRTAPPADAVRSSLEALSWLQDQGCSQFYFKYCSTFDSTAQGNIGPVIDAVMSALDTGFTIACPAFPENGRTVYQGYLFVGDLLLSESGMRHHPLTPMTDPNLVRVLQAQTAQAVGQVVQRTVGAGPRAILSAFETLQANGTRIAIVDAVSEADMDSIGAACADMRLITAGSGVGLGLARYLRAQGRLPHAADAAELPAVKGLAAVVAGSCSLRTNEQVAHWSASRPAFRIDPMALARGEPVVAAALAWADTVLHEGPPLIYATSTPQQVQEVQAVVGVERAGTMIEESLAAVACGLVARGVRKLVVAGGETSGAVVQALEVHALRIGQQIDPGVPWTMAQVDGAPLALALKSGNFGTVDFFEKSLRLIDGLA